MNRIIMALVAYALCAILSFGHAASNAKCDLDRHRLCSVDAAVTASFAGIFWPLYLSWVAFDQTKGGA